MNVYTVAIFVAFALFIAVGVYMSRSVKNKADYFVSGRSAGVALVVGTLVASYLSTVAMMGEAGFSYEGFPWLILLIAPLAQGGYLLGVFLFGRYLRRAESLTVPEFFGRRYNSRRLQGVAGLMVLVGIGLYLVAVTRGLTLVLANITGLNEAVLLLIVWVAFTTFTIVSGSKGVIVTDTLMFFLFMVAGVGGLLVVMHAAGGVDNVVSTMAADPQWREGLMWHGDIGPESALTTPLDSLLYFLVFGLVWMFVVAVSPWQSSRYMMAKTGHVAIRSGAIAMVVIIAFYVFLVFGSYAVNLINPNIEPTEIVFIWAGQNVMPLWLGILAVTGVMAAGLSSASTFLSLVGFSAVQDVIPWLTRKQPADEAGAEGLKESRWSMVVIGFVVLAITYVASPTVLSIGYMAASFFAAAWGIVAIASTQSRKMTEPGAFYGMILGGVTLLVLEGLSTFGGVELPTLLNPVLVALAASVIGILIGNASSTPDPQGLAFLDSISKPSAADTSTVEVRKTKVYLGISAVTMVAVMGALVWFYVIPMETAL
ncbi:sodium:solute symporter family protein [Citricoccus nitrophenolicus]|uniref:sodium:solute symporter family protein n=1 Tax=Citricoccus nitrophenolicus TaxID=863575 RepID=UPI0039B4E1A1